MSADFLLSSCEGGSARRGGEQGRLNVRGITLKEYFRLCEEEQLKEIKEESVQSSKSSLLQTPAFPPPASHPKHLVRFRTQPSDPAEDLPVLPGELPSNRTPPVKCPKVKECCLREPAVQQRRKVLTKMPYSSTKPQLEGVKRSTLGCFYQMGEKQRKMLRKVQADREKAEEMTLREALCITKYSRLRLEEKL